MHRNLRLILFVLVLISIFVGMGILSAQARSAPSLYLRSVTLPLDTASQSVRIAE